MPEGKAEPAAAAPPSGLPLARQHVPQAAGLARGAGVRRRGGGAGWGGEGTYAEAALARVAEEHGVEVASAQHTVALHLLARRARRGVIPSSG